jgi:hypothetical protein
MSMKFTAWGLNIAEAMRMPPVKSGETISSAPGAQRLVDVAPVVHARDDARLGPQRPRRHAHDEVAAVVARHREDTRAARHACPVENLVVGGVPVHHELVPGALLVRRDGLAARLDHDERALRGDQLVGDIAADATDAADDVVVPEFTDGARHTPPPVRLG